MSKWICDTCIHLDEREYKGEEVQIAPNQWQWVPPSTVYYCKKQHRIISRVITTCKDYISIHTKTLEVNEQGMVNINDIPDEGERYELDDLPQTLELIATGEREVEKAPGKAGGLVIYFKDRKGKTLAQKYTLISGTHLRAALKDLGLKDTEDLQKAFYEYTRTPMRTGYPRMIPTKKAA